MILALLCLLVAKADLAGQPSSKSHDQEWLYTTWTVDDGLPVNSVNDLAVDEQGYLWLATFDGLARFDGFRFRIFQSQNSQLPSNRIYVLHRITGGLLIQFEGDQVGIFRHSSEQYEDLAEAGRVSAVHIVPPETDRPVTVWLGNLNGEVFRYHAASQPSLQRLTHEPLGSPIGNILPTPTGGAWIATQRRLLLLQDEKVVAHDLSKLVDSAIPSLVGDSPLVGPAIHRLMRDSLGGLWVATARGLLRYQKGHATWMLEDSEILEISEDGAAVWALARHPSRFSVGADSSPELTSHQMLEISADLQAHVREAVGEIPDAIDLLRFAQRWSSRPMLTDRLLSSVRARDRNGNLWIAQRQPPLYQVRPSPVRVMVEKEQAVESRNIYPIFQDGHGDIWLGTWGGGLMHGRNGAFHPHSEPGRYISSIGEIGGELVVGTMDAGVFRGVHEEFLPLPLDPEIKIGAKKSPFINAESFRATHPDRQGRLWFGFDGVGLLSWESGDWTYFGSDQDFPFRRVRVFAETSDGTLWMGTSGEGLILRLPNERFVQLTESDGLAGDAVRSIYPDSDGFVWIGTESGLTRADWSHQHLNGIDLRPITVAQGLYDGTIHQILEDGQERLWMNTNQGVFWVRKEALHNLLAGRRTTIFPVFYTEKNGLRNREGNGGVHPAGIKDNQGQLWFPTQDGAAVFDPARISVEAPPAIVEELRTESGIRVLAGDAVELPQGERNFEISFTALEFSMPDQVNFRFMLEGFDPGWRPAARRTASYTNTPPGDYNFRVQAGIGDQWSEAETPLPIGVPPYFHETAWFYLICFGVLASLAAAGYRFRVRRLKERERELTRTVKEKTEDLRQALDKVSEQANRLRELDRAKSVFFSNLSHEFRTPLTLIQAPLEDLLAQDGNPSREETVKSIDYALENSRKLLRMVNQLLDLSKAEARSLVFDFQPGDLRDFLEARAAAFTPLAERRGIGFEVILPAGEIWSPFDREQLVKVFDNLLSNAFKFTPRGGRVRLRATLGPAKDNVRVHIEDSGPGIPEELTERVFERFYQVEAHETGSVSAGTGIGLALAREIAESHGGHISVESEAGRGSRFTVELPIEQTRQESSADLLSAGLDSDQDFSAEASQTPLAVQADETSPPNGEEPFEGETEPDDDRVTVLVVEDNAEVRRYLRENLETTYRVLEAENGTQALGVAIEEVPDLIVSDWVMPEMDGLELCRQVRSDSRIDFIPIILLTAKAEQESKLTGLEGGADDYVTKPFHPSELKARMRGLIRLRQRLKQHYLMEDPEQTQPLKTGRPIRADDQIFLKRVYEVLSSNLSDEEFRVEQWAEELALSRVHLYRKLRELTDRTPSQLIGAYRLEQAAKMLRAGAGTVSEVAYAVGFKSVSHFSRRFLKEYGRRPSSLRSA